MASTQPARGTRDFLPADVRRREHVIGVVRRVYERYGFEPLETPAFENIETLLGKYGEEGGKLIFKILRRGEHESSGQADLALRYDLTVPLARVIAEHQSTLPKYFRRYQIQPVWRADRPARGRFREFYQCDVDAIGSTSPVVEVEVISAVCEVLAALGFQDFRVRLNDRRLLRALLAAAGVPPALETDALVSLDKLDKIGAQGVTADMAGRGIDPGVAAECLRLFAIGPDATVDAVIAGLRVRLGADASVLDTLTTIVALSESTPAAGRIQVDPSLARGLSYYTGAIMEIAVPDLAGSLGGGGRYDNLVGMFLGRDVPACGFSLGLERLIVVMTERGMFPASVGLAPADVLVTLWDEMARGDALALASDLRRAGLRVDVYPEPEKPGRQLKYASAREYPVVLIAGDDERREGTVTVKNMRTTGQATIARADVVAHIRAQVGSAPDEGRSGTRSE
jgi:histidyl-tRNA synthetase